MTTATRASRSALHRPARWLATALAAIVAACGSRVDDTATLTIFAASSLTEVAADLEAAFERAHPGVDVRLSLAGSQTLRTQIEAGAPADVFISADLRHMEAAEAAGHTARPVLLAGNRLVVVTTAANPAGIEDFRDLGKARRLVLAAPEVPAGAYAREVIARAGAALGGDFAAKVLSQVVSEEPNIRLVRAKVLLGEADAAILYATDGADTDLRVIEIRDAWNAATTYPMARLVRAPSPALADAFIAFATGPEGRAVLERRGFSPPPEPR
jgi:molybdate transport system substrate-binding protein